MTKRYGSCVFPNCDEPQHIRKMCRRHYAWNRYHALRNHDPVYFIEYIGRHEELAARGRLLARPRLMRKRA